MSTLIVITTTKAFNEHYHEVLHVLDGAFTFVFQQLEERCAAELKTVQVYAPFRSGIFGSVIENEKSTFKR